MRWIRYACLMSLVLFTPVVALAAPAPSEHDLGKLRHELYRRAVRLHVRNARYEIERARVDSAGVWFAPDATVGAGTWSHGEKLSPPALAPPVTWRDLESIEAENIGVWRGMFLGALIAPVAVLAWPGSHEGEDWSAAYAVLSVPVGAAVGAIVGAAIPAWKQVWPPPDAGAP